MLNENNRINNWVKEKRKYKEEKRRKNTQTEEKREWIFSFENMKNNMGKRSD